MLELHDITKRYDDFTLGPLDLTVGNEVVVVLGPSGSGKTTLLSLIAGITPLDSGDIVLHGNSISTVPLEHRNTGLVFQDGSLFPHMTARENIEYAATTNSIVTEVAETLEITSILDQSPATLSGGETQRIALARTLAAEPAVLLLDEPLSSLDTPTRRRLRDELHRVFDSLNIPIILVTHNQRTAMSLGDRLTILRDGAIEQIGTPGEIHSNPASPFVAEFTGNSNLIDATVTDRTSETITLKTGTHTLTTAGEWSVGTTVTMCIHPARITIHAEPPAPDPPDNLISGEVERWLHEGSEYRVYCTISDLPTPLTVTVSPTKFEALNLGPNTPVHLELPPNAIHILTASTSTPPTRTN